MLESLNVNYDPIWYIKDTPAQAQGWLKRSGQAELIH